MDRDEGEYRTAAVSPERLAALLDASPAVLYSFRADGDHEPTFVSGNLARLFGYEPREYLEKPSFWRERVHPDDLPRVADGFARLLETGHHTCEYRFRRKDGSYRWVEDRQRLLRGPDGTPEEVVGSWTDVDDRKRAEAALLETERRLGHFLEASSDWLWETDEAHRFTSDSDERRKGGVGPSRLLGHTRWEFAGVRDPRADPAWRAHLADLDARRPFRGFRYTARDDGGKLVHFEVNGAPVFDEAGAFRGYRGTTSNVTGRERAEAARRETERRLRDAVESISEGFVLYDADDRLVICNRRYAELFLPGRDDLLRPGVPYRRLLDGIARSGRLALPEGGVERWTTLRLERRRRPDEPYELALADGRCFRVADRRTGEGGTVSVFAEVTDVKDREAALRAGERRFRLLVENMRGIIFCRGVAGRGPHGYDEQGVRIYGADAQRLAGTVDERGRARIAAWYDAVHPEDRPAYAASERRRKEGHEPYALDYRITHPETGEERWMREVAWVVEDPSAGRTYFDSYIIDITEQKRREAALDETRARLEAQNRELRAMSARAEAADRAKTEFLAAMSHEIRTPLTGVLGMADLLAAADLPGRERRRVEAIRTSGRHLLGVVNDILDFSRIEAGELTPERIDFGLAEVLEQVRSLLAPQALERGLELRFSYTGYLPPVACGDPTRLAQVLLNLVGNGLKFTSRGEVTVHLTSRREGGGRFVVRFEVRDTGIGMRDEQVAGMFRPFTQADRSTARRYGGSGLGLAISKRLVEAMGGNIGAESAAGAGSLFWFEVPLERGDAVTVGERAAFDPASVPPLRVLVAEDVAVNRELLGEVLGRHGHEVAFAADGAEAVQRAAGGGFDLVLMDVQMPAMDGLEATRRIRRLEGPAGRVPVVGLTANVLASERERYLAAGMDRCLTKPIAWEELFVALDEVTRDGASPPPAADARGNDLPLLAGVAAGPPGDARLAGLLGRALEEVERGCTRLKALPAGSPEVAAVAHELKGIAGLYGLKRVSAAASEVQAAAREGRETAGLVERLATAAAATREALREAGLEPG